MKTKNIILGLVIFIINIQVILSQSPINKGFELLEKGDFDQAELFFEGFIKENPTHKTALLCYGRAVGLNGNPQKAMSIFDKLLKEEPNNLEFLLNQAECYLWNNDFKNAQEKYTILVNTYPSSAIIFLGLGNTYSNLKKFKKAIDFYNRGITIKNDILGLYIGLAYTYHANNENLKALETIDLGLTIDVSNPQLNQLKNKINETYKVTIEQKNSTISDNDDNRTIQVITKIKKPINTKTTIGLVHQYRKINNDRLLSKATQNTFGLFVERDITNNINLSGGINYLLSRSDTNYENLLYNISLKMKPRHNQSLSFNYQKEYHNFNTQLINAKIAQNHYFANYHILTNINIGYFTQYYFTKQSDNNQRHLWFNSIYYILKKKNIFKIGANFQSIQFKEEMPEIYFSPERFSLIEGFTIINLFNKSKTISANSTLAYGYQFINNNDKQESFRIKLELGYQLSKKAALNVFYNHSNLASSTAAGFEFNEFGIKGNYRF